jgi:hypothetical protein
MLSSFSKSTSQHEEVTKDLLRELGKVRKEVLRENQRMEEIEAVAEEKEMVALMMRKRLLYLFMKDLSNGVSGEVLSSKFRRDSQTPRSSSLPAKMNRVSWQQKGMAGLLVTLLDAGMLFYVYLFAMNQTQSRQQAWFISFVMWLGFEICFSSTAFVLILHLLLPLYVWSDVAKVKDRVIKDLMKFGEKYLKRDGHGVEDDIETGTGTGKDFNAARYLFPSWRVALLFPEVPESQFVLRFSTPWPKKRFGKEQGSVAKEYEDDVLLSAASRILLYFLTSLLHYSSLVQDIIIQTVCNGVLGYLLVLLIQLWTARPWMAAVAVLGLFLCVYWLGRLSLDSLAKKLEDKSTRSGSDVEFKRSPSSPLDKEKEKTPPPPTPPKETSPTPFPSPHPVPQPVPVESEQVSDSNSSNDGFSSSADDSGSSDSDMYSRESFQFSDSDGSSDLDISIVVVSASPSVR